MDHNLSEYILIEFLSRAKVNADCALDTLQTTNGRQKFNLHGL